MPRCACRQKFGSKVGLLRADIRIPYVVRSLPCPAVAARPLLRNPGPGKLAWHAAVAGGVALVAGAESIVVGAAFAYALVLSLVGSAPPRPATERNNFRVPPSVPAVSANVFVGGDLAAVRT